MPQWGNVTRGQPRTKPTSSEPECPNLGADWERPATGRCGEKRRRSQVADNEDDLDFGGGRIEEAQRGRQNRGPGWHAKLVRDLGDQLDTTVVAEAADAGIGEAIRLVRRDLAILRIVQRLEDPLVDPRHQAFGLPGQVTSARIDFLDLSAGAAQGWQHAGAATGWTFSDRHHVAWSADPGYRFLDQALSCPEDRWSPLQRRALVTAGLLSQAWLSWLPDLALLTSVMAFEVPLGEPGDGRLRDSGQDAVCPVPRLRIVVGHDHAGDPDGRRASRKPMNSMHKAHDTR